MIQCPRCASIKTVKNGIRDGSQRHFCKTCSGEFRVRLEEKVQSGNILIIGDTHMPFEHPDYLPFCKSIAEKYKVDEVYHVGDIVDNHSISYHEVDPRSHGASKEIEEAVIHLQDWYNAFPKMHVCMGNHDALTMRKAKTVGLPVECMRPLRDILGMPDGWEMDWSYTVNDILIVHGTGFSGLYAHTTASRSLMRSIVMGHTHSVSGVQYTAVEDKLIFGMAVGCGIDRKSHAFSYGAMLPRKPILSCGILLEGKTPLIETMGL